MDIYQICIYPEEFTKRYMRSSSSVLLHPSRSSLIDSAPEVIPNRNFSPHQADLMDTVARLRNEIYELKFALPISTTPVTWTSSARPRPAAFRTTKVHKFSGSTIWDQYRQAFDTIVSLNGWDDATVALQLLSHVEGDALNMALFVLEATRVTRIGLVGAQTDHYGSPDYRLLADYRRQFEKNYSTGWRGSVNIGCCTSDSHSQGLRGYGPEC